MKQVRRALLTFIVFIINIVQNMCRRANNKLNTALDLHRRKMMQFESFSLLPQNLNTLALDFAYFQRLDLPAEFTVLSLVMYRPTGQLVMLMYRA